MKNRIIATVFAILITVAGFSQTSGKLESSKTHIKFFSTTPVEDIEADNYLTVSTINIETGDVFFLVPMKSFVFEKAMMQKHFNQEKFLDTETYPKAKLEAKITNLDQINFNKDGTYNAVVKGQLTIKSVTKDVTEKGTITVKGGLVIIKSVFNVNLKDYNIQFAGMLSSKIAEDIEVTVHAEY